MNKILFKNLFYRFLQNRKKPDTTFSESKVINTYKHLWISFWKLSGLTLVSFASLLVQDSINYYIFFPLLVILIVYLFKITIWVIFNKSLLKKDKFFVLIVGIIYVVLIFAFAYSTLPNSEFNVNENLNYSNLLTWLYYSLIVFSTVGFGDITPIGPIAIPLTIVEIIFHYVYMVFAFSLILSYDDNMNKEIHNEINNYMKEKKS